MKKMLFFAGLCLALWAFFAAETRAGHKPVIGILQTASHPALDRAREGFLEELGDAFEVRVQNAEGLISQAQLIASHFHQDPNVKAVFSIATPATQVMAHVERDKPIVFCAVTEPSLLGIPETQVNVTGIQDMIDVQKQVALLKRLVPEAKTVALLFNPGEVNSLALSKLFKEELKRQELDSIEVGIQSEAEVSVAMRSACQRADVILTPTDHTVAATIQVLARTAREFKKALIVSDNLLVKQGALAARGVDYGASGREAAKMLRAILLEKRSPSEFPIRASEDGEVVINEETRSLLGL